MYVFEVFNMFNPNFRPATAVLVNLSLSLISNGRYYVTFYLGSTERLIV